MTDDFAGFAAYGTSVTIDGTPIYGVGDITGPALSTDTSDTTNHSSPDATEQMIATIKRVGTLAFPMVTDPTDAGQQALYAAWHGRTLNDYVVTKPSGIIHSFSGYCTGFGDGAPVTGHESLSVVLRPASWPADSTTFPAS